MTKVKIGILKLEKFAIHLTDGYYEKENKPTEKYKKDINQYFMLEEISMASK